MDVLVSYMLHIGLWTAKNRKTRDQIVYGAHENMIASPIKYLSREGFS